MPDGPDPSTAADHRPREVTPADLGFTPARPVAWLSPIQLAGTGLRVALASIQGGYLDKRELQASMPGTVYREFGPNGDCWIDYVADLGDGFDATYAVASLLARPELEVDGQVLPRGQALVLGGDEVYPTPSAQLYEDRMIGPYRAALPRSSEPAPTMYALPGNHDWYDGLTAFLRIFTSTRRTRIGGWQLPQTRSYFALDLPGDWWLLAIDDQASTYIDDPQLAYFTEVAQRFGPSTNLIVAPPSPTWVQSHDNPQVYGALDYFIRTVIEPTGARVRLMLSGDWHHYARYSGGPGRELITCGGGGAYLYPTHLLPERIEVPPRTLETDSPRHDYALAGRFPGKLRSQGYAAEVFTRLPRRNPSFIALLGGLHTAVLLAASGVVHNSLGSAEQKFSLVPLTALIAAVLAGTYAFAHLNAPPAPDPKRRALGFAHGLAQLALAALGTWVWWELPPQGWGWPWSLVAAVVLYGTVSGLAATELFAGYLLVAARLGVNVNELFSAQGIVDAKSFLRMHFAADGTLTVHPIGLRRTPRRWRADPDGAPTDPWLTPVGGLHPHLIEDPVVIPPAPHPR